jgi:hypothetical protein
VISLALIAFVLAAAVPGNGDGGPSALEVEAAVRKVASEGEIWPGYDPLAVPLAVFDGSETHLFRHPAPPGDFVEREGRHVFEGRHPSVVANSSAWIGEAATATVWLETLSAGSTARNCAALVLHEGFHVFQGTTGRRWGADESQLFLYPVDDDTLLSIRRLETEALRRAFESDREDAEACWARLALDLRSERFRHMDDPFVAYERGIETLEGTAAYVQHRAEKRDTLGFPAEGFGAEDVRSRAYVTGVAWALLLDRFEPGWRDGFGADDGALLDVLLADALTPSASSLACAFTPAERAAALRVARDDVAEVQRGRTERREAFESSPGWTIIVEAAPSSPLWPRGFDPLNLTRVEGGVLHTRFLKLGNESGGLEVMGGTVLTEEVGPHPILNGILRATLAGLPDEPAVESDGGRVTVTAPVLTAEFERASVERADARIVIRLPAGE